SITSSPLVAHAGDSVTLAWNNSPNDTDWTLFLVNATVFLSLYQSWDNINPDPGSAVLLLRADLEPGNDYQFRIVQSNWVDYVLAFGPQFSIVA
ncbi:hypothetical protein BDQ17DRAFT_1415633, partial [Cyathus striatus]